MRCMVLIYGSEAAWKRLGEADFERIGDAHKAVQAELRASGELVDHKELVTEGARVVRRADGAAEVSDGPFSEGAQILGGYYMLDCADLARATAIAARFVESEFAPVEVRQLSGESTWEGDAPSA